MEDLNDDEWKRFVNLHPNKSENCATAEIFEDFVLLISTTTTVFTIRSLFFCSIWSDLINEHSFVFVFKHGGGGGFDSELICTKQSIYKILQQINNK